MLPLAFSVGETAGVANQIPSVASVVAKQLADAPQFRFPSVLESVTCFGRIASKLLTGHLTAVLRKYPEDWMNLAISSCFATGR